MNIVDAVIILLILLFGVIGFKNGVIKQTVQFFGTFFIIALAFLTRDFLASFMIKNFPFFNFSGGFSNLTTLNILLYNLLAFLIMLAIYGMILQLIVTITGVFEKLLRFTIVLGIPSKILGFFMGLLQGVLVSFIILIILNQPFINLKIVNDSKSLPVITNKIPGLSKEGQKLTNVANDIYDLKLKYDQNQDSDEFNRLTLDSMLKYNITDVKTIRQLVTSGKLNINGVDAILNKY